MYMDLLCLTIFDRAFPGTGNNVTAVIVLCSRNIELFSDREDLIHLRGNHFVPTLCRGFYVPRRYVALDTFYSLSPRFP